MFVGALLSLTINKMIWQRDTGGNCVFTKDDLDLESNLWHCDDFKEGLWLTDAIL